MRLSPRGRAKRQDIEEGCLFSSDDEGIAKYFGVPAYEVGAIRIELNSRLENCEEPQIADHEQGSRQLRQALDRLFQHWEGEHGFQRGAGKILLPAGFVP